ncbi:hypothetical protein WCE10_20735 [Cronobacter muytjensii]|uniref:hypothetical protein n=1 Tax=Cronobacter muytjensii TaxID=413501 RepID=UPI0006ACCE59
MYFTEGKKMRQGTSIGLTLIVELALPKFEGILSHCPASSKAEVECVFVFTAFPFQFRTTG